MDERLIKNAPRMRGHSAHPPLTDFPIALLGISLLWDIVAIWSGNDIWWQFSFWSQIAGLVAVVPTALTGFVEYIALPTESPASRVATWHMLVMITATLPYIGSVLVRGGSSSPSGSQLIGAVALNAFGLCLLMAGGWLGGELVSRHGLGTVAEATHAPTSAEASAEAVQRGPDAPPAESIPVTTSRDGRH